MKRLFTLAGQRKGQQERVRYDAFGQSRIEKVGQSHLRMIEKRKIVLILKASQ